MKAIQDLFGGQHQLEEEVIILPYRGGTGTGGGYVDGTYSLPAGYSWTDFERVEFYSGYYNNSTDTQDMRGGVGILTKDIINAKPTSWKIMGGFYSTTTAYTIKYDAVNNSQFTVDAIHSSSRPYLVKAYRRRYATQNVSAIINVNNGNDIGVNQRYEIDIASALGQDYVGKDLIVQAEIYNNSGSGVEGWGVPNFIYRSSSTEGRGVTGNVVGDKIVIQTGSGALASGNASYQGHPFSALAANIASAPCRVKVWKIDQFISNTSGGGNILGGYTELIENGNTLDAATHNNLIVSDATSPVVISNVPTGAYTCTLIVGSNSADLSGLSIKWQGGSSPSFSGDEDLIFLTTVDQGATWYGSSSLGHV